jgi:hypothetical protein
MKSIKTNLTRFAFVMAVIFATTVFNLGAQTPKEELGFILSMTEFKVKSGQNDQFREGVVAWKKCYLENGGTWTWNMWHRVQGEGNVYILTSRMEKWAEMDETDEAAKKCRDIVKNQIIPHIETSADNFARFMPAISKEYPNPDALIWVTYWKLTNGLKFREIVKQLNEEVRKVEGAPRSYWYGMIGGSAQEPDIFAATPFKNYAAMDVERDAVWTIYENVYGKEKRDQLQDEFRATVDEVWSYIYNKVDELSRSE